MSFATSDALRWALGAGLGGVVCGLSWWRGLARRLPVFTTYVTLVVLRDAAWWIILRNVAISSPFAFDSYWTMQEVLFLMRCAVVVEVCRKAVAEYRGIWALGWRLLVGVALLMILLSAIMMKANLSRVSHWMLAGERGLELTVLVSLITLLVFSHYYHIALETPLPLLIAGLGFYSAVQVINNTFLRALKGGFLSFWAELRVDSFALVLALWAVAIWKPLPERSGVSVSLSGPEYGWVVPSVNERLRQMNDRLSELLK